MGSALPIIDVGALVRGGAAGAGARLIAGRAIDRASRETGFFYVRNHGVDESLRSRVLSLGRRFFELPQASKDAISVANSPSFRGYQRVGENVTGGAPDWHEAVDWFRDGDDVERPPSAASPGSRTRADAKWFKLAGRNQWPSEADVPGFRLAYDEYVSSMLLLGGSVMRGVALGLGKEEAFFEPWYTRSFWILRLIRYPPISHPGDGVGGDVDGDAPADERSLGCGAHTDYGCLTLLHADNAPGCLQVRAPDGCWRDAPTLPGAFLVNIGDALQAWSAGRYRSTEHRVLRPHEGCRISVPFFFEPNADALIAPVVQQEKPMEKMEARASAVSSVPLVYGEYLQQKVLNNFDFGGRDR